jgi:hypothetical protein
MKEKRLARSKQRKQVLTSNLLRYYMAVTTNLMLATFRYLIITDLQGLEFVVS